MRGSAREWFALWFHGLSYRKYSRVGGGVVCCIITADYSVQGLRLYILIITTNVVKVREVCTVCTRRLYQNGSWLSVQAAILLLHDSFELT